MFVHRHSLIHLRHWDQNKQKDKKAPRFFQPPPLPPAYYVSLNFPTLLFMKTPCLFGIEKYLQIITFLSNLAVYYAPKCNDPMDIPSLDSSILNETFQQEIEWLDTTVALNCPWECYLASQKRYKKHRKGFTAVLTLLYEKVHVLSMQYHRMNIVTNTVNKVNPGKTPVDVCDHVIFPLTKQIQ